MPYWFPPFYLAFRSARFLSHYYLRFRVYFFNLVVPAVGNGEVIFDLYNRKVNGVVDTEPSFQFFM